MIPFINGLGWYAAGMFAAGLGVSAVMIGAMQIIERALPRSRLTEALALAISGVLIGSAGAVALAGALIDAGGSSWGLAVGSVAALVGLGVAALARPALARAESLVPADGTVASPEGAGHLAREAHVRANGAPGAVGRRNSPSCVIEIIRSPLRSNIRPRAKPRPRSAAGDAVT